MSNKQLPAPLRARMERAFGADFSAVTIHEDGAAGALGAEAYARGDALHFAPGRYDPDSPAGEELIAHELAHVVQQRRGRVAAGAGDTDVDGNLDLEREADQLAATAVAGGTAHVAHGSGVPGAGAAIQAKFVTSTSYRTRAAMPVLAPYDRQPHATLDPNTNFECVGGLGRIPRSRAQGYRIRSEGRAVFVRQTVADDDATYWEVRNLPAAIGRNTPTTIADWDVGEGDSQVGGVVTGVGERDTTLRTSVKWGPVVDGPGGFEEGTWMEATCLGPDHPTGSKNEWPVGSVGAATGIVWVGGHLLNDHLGGPGNDPRNIVSIPSKNTNCYHESQVEDAVKYHVNTRGGWAYYKVEATHKRKPIAKTRRNPRAAATAETQDSWQRADGRTEVNIATELKSVWYPLDAAGRQAGPAQRDSFPIPDPLTIQGVSTDPDNEPAWHVGPTYDRPGQTQPPFYSPRCLSSPVDAPSTGHPEEYPYRGYNAEAPSDPWARREQIEPVVKSTFVEVGARRAPPRLMVPTASLQDMLVKAGFTLGESTNGGIGVSRSPAPRIGQPSVQQQLETAVGRHIKTNPTGVSSTLTRGRMVATHLERRRDLAEDEVEGQILETLAGSADYQAWLAHAKRKRRPTDAGEAERGRAGEADDNVGTSEPGPSVPAREQEEDDEESELTDPRAAPAQPPPTRRKRRRVTVRVKPSNAKASDAEAASSDQP